MIGNVTKVTLNFFSSKKLDNIEDMEGKTFRCNGGGGDLVLELEKFCCCTDIW